MFIQTEDTPNPQSMKFLPGQPVLGEGALGVDFPTMDSAAASPLAQLLFETDGVMGVYLGADFITVTKTEAVEWMHIKPAILGAVADFLTAGLPVLREGAAPSSSPVAVRCARLRSRATSRSSSSMRTSAPAEAWRRRVAKSSCARSYLAWASLTRSPSDRTSLSWLAT